MQPFLCPQCGQHSTYDPWARAAECPRCGFTPPQGSTSGYYARWVQRHAYQPYLDELLAHWNGSHTPDRAFTLETPDDAIAFFRDYQRALGEDPHLDAGSQAHYVRDHQPHRQEILIFAGAYFRLRRGDRARAAQDLHALIFANPEFVDPWVWLTGTTDDPAERRKYLDKAASLDAGHPLARDALALTEGRVLAGPGLRKDRIVTTQCPQCGANFCYEPGTDQVTCLHCGHQIEMQRINLIDGEARPVHHLRLKRRFEGHTWAEAQRVVHCHTCGAELTMSQHLANNCAFCGSTNVLVEEGQRVLQQPDGILPFEIGRDHAAVAVRREQGRLTRRLVSWVTGRHHDLRGLQGIYLPFWVFDGIVETYHYGKNRSRTQKQTLGWGTQENLIFSGVDAPAPPLISEIYPFRLDALVPYEPRLLADWPARLYSLDVELVAEAARTAMVGRARSQSSPVLAAAEGQQLAFQVIGTTYQLVLLPVWSALLVCEDEHCLALVNGQTGQVARGPTVRPGDPGERRG
jgi:DNA-directed RNA polymerase subunit RPC12/RpoP